VQYATASERCFRVEAFSFASAIDECSSEFLARFRSALAESRRCEAERIIQRYKNLRTDPKS
jgi:hypothetical protein